jgi:hypothetical protein
VTFAAAAETTAEDRQRYGVGHGRVVVIETAWLRRVCDCTLRVYELPPALFRMFDESAGYWVTNEAVEPIDVSTMTDLPSAILERGAELRTVHRLWPLHDAVAKSTLEFSMIRMRNAAT